ncbi:MAG: tetratricopeptide repeat protein [Novosphingobium sp.]
MNAPTAKASDCNPGMSSKPMAEGQTRHWRISAWLLLLAILGVGLSVGIALRRHNGASGGTSDQAVALAGDSGDPLTVLEARTRDNPQDGGAWSALAGAYFESGRFDEAAGAYDTAVKLAPQQAALWSGRGEARVMASAHDPMPAAAAADFERAVALDPKDPRARYFLAVKQDLSGDHQGAIDSWLGLLADTPPGAAWEADLRRTITQAAKINHIDASSKLAAVQQPAAQLPAPAPILPGPSAEDINRASALRPSEQRTMAEGMVARLESKLKTDPANVDGWIMLIRSRMTLGQPDLARTALANAVAANPARANELREQAAALGVR